MKQLGKIVCVATIIVLVPFCYGSVVLADECVVLDNGSGTVDLPADCPYTAPYEPMYIIDGLPPETTIEMEPTFEVFYCDSGTPCTNPPTSFPNCEGVGGSLGGNYQCFEATLDLVVEGTGDLTGFSRHLAVPVNAEIHTGSRTPGESVQTFPADMYRSHGQLFGDPDFCEFIVTGGTDYGLPSPGQTNLTEQSGGYFTVDSFFDITYQIEFEGCPGSVLDGYSGTTTATIRWQQGLRSDGDCDSALNSLDNCPNDYNPGQEDTMPPGGNNCGDLCECEGDFESDGDVDGTDAVKFKTDFFRKDCAEPTPCKGDFECDGDVDGSDAVKFKRDFFRKDCPSCTFSCF